MRTINSTIISANLANITNSKTGEVNTLTRITYTVDRTDNENVVGPGILDCYRPGNLINKIKGNTMKPLKLEIEERPTNNGVKFVIESINGIKL